MRIIRFSKEGELQLAAVTDEANIYALPFANFLSLMEEAERKGGTCLSLVKQVIQDSLPLEEKLDDLSLQVPVDAYEVWASGVTYVKSRDARNYESKAVTDSYYDKVYVADRPELFLKSTGRRTIGPRAPLYLRSDSNWQIPEPELGLVLNRAGKIVGYTIGNDMSSRDIEGENPLYLTQAKIWKHSCSIGPAIRLAETVADPYRLTITCRIVRDGAIVFEDSASTSQLKRTYDELVSYLLRDNEIFDGTVLLTGTCIVPDSQFTLKVEDRIDIEIPEIGLLSNPVKEQVSVKI